MILFHIEASVLTLQFKDSLLTHGIVIMVGCGTTLLSVDSS